MIFLFPRVGYVNPMEGICPVLVYSYESVTEAPSVAEAEEGPSQAWHLQLLLVGKHPRKAPVDIVSEVWLYITKIL